MGTIFGAHFFVFGGIAVGEALVGDPNQDRAAKDRELAQALDDLDILPLGFRESEAGVEDRGSSR